MKLRLRLLDEYTEPLNRQQFYVVLWRERDQRGINPIHRKAILEALVEKPGTPNPWGGTSTEVSWEAFEIAEAV